MRAASCCVLGGASRLERKPADLLVKLAREGGGFEAYDARQK
jgi:hypothetical protein